MLCAHARSGCSAGTSEPNAALTGKNKSQYRCLKKEAREFARAKGAADWNKGRASQREKGAISMRVDQSSCEWNQIIHSKVLLRCDDGALTARKNTKGPPVAQSDRRKGRRGGGRLAD